MNSLTLLKNLIHKLKKEEVRSLYRFLEFNTERMDSSQLKSQQLVDLILDNREYSPLDLQKTIYGKENHVAFNKLVIRLYDKVLEVITLDVNLNRGYYSARGKKVFELRKKMIQVDLLILKGLRENLNRELDKIIEQSLDFEIYDILIQALYSKQRFSVVDSKRKYNEKIKSDIVHAEKCWAAFNVSQSVFNSIVTKINSSAGGYDFQKELDRAVSLLEMKYEETKSPMIGFHYLFLATEKAQKEFDYSTAGKFLDKLIHVIEKNKSVYNDVRYGSALLNIANNMIHLLSFKEANEYVQKAKYFFKEQPVNMSILEEIEFYICFYSSDLIQAKSIITKLVNSPSSFNVPLLLSKWNYLMGCTLFLDNEFELCLNILSNRPEIEQDKEGWNFQKRILIIMSRIEMKDMDSADLNLQSLDKFMKRILKSKFVRPRLVLIVRILKKLINENLNFASVYDSRKKYFDLLESNHSDYRWEIKSPELIIFNEWFRRNAENRKYNQDEVMDLLIKKYSIY
ncbi:MAG TPA: hypothetical protein PLU53_10510 [Bacteroidia bacterium]|nr:hypothetical protein [Bacteroidia bacterium]